MTPEAQAQVQEMTRQTMAAAGLSVPTTTPKNATKGALKPA
jgi:hypothetical protein